MGWTTTYRRVCWGFIFSEWQTKQLELEIVAVIIVWCVITVGNMHGPWTMDLGEWKQKQNKQEDLILNGDVELSREIHGPTAQVPFPCSKFIGIQTNHWNTTKKKKKNTSIYFRTSNKFPSTNWRMCCIKIQVYKGNMATSTLANAAEGKRERAMVEAF